MAGTVSVFNNGPLVVNEGGSVLFSSTLTYLSSFGSGYDVITNVGSSSTSPTFDHFR